MGHCSSCPGRGSCGHLGHSFLFYQGLHILSAISGAFLGAHQRTPFLTVPAKKGSSRDGVPFYDLLLALISIFLGLYVTLYYPKVLFTLGIISTARVLLGVLAVMIVLESTRRLEGWALTLIILFFIAYALFSNYLPGILQTRGVPWRRLVIQLYLGADSLFGPLSRWRSPLSSPSFCSVHF